MRRCLGPRVLPPFSSDLASDHAKVSVLNGLPLEHDRRVRLAGLRVHDVIAQGLGKNIAPELKNMFGAWAMLMHDRHKDCRELALTIFEKVFPAHKREATWLYCQEQLFRTVGDTLGHQPETLCTCFLRESCLPVLSSLLTRTRARTLSPPPPPSHTPPC